jgi:elongation factor P--(R)-beta-lysine ligase
VSEILAPSELLKAPSGTRCCGGRVTLVANAHSELSDAFGAVRLRFDAAPLLSVGDLVVVRGQWDEAVLSAAELVERHRYPEPRGDSDFARLAWDGVGARLRQRSHAFACVREYFAEEGFLEVDPPLRVPAPGVDLHLDAIPAEGGYLITSPELHLKRLLAAGMPRIYALVHASRRGELGQFHEPEFTLLEWYRAFAGMDDVLRDTERLVARVATRLCGSETLSAPDGMRIDCRPPFERMSVRDAFRAYAGVSDAVDLAASAESHYFELFVQKVEPALAMRPTPLFLCEYPATQAALARTSAADPSVAERFELYAGGVELCNGFGELTDPIEQRRRFEHDHELRFAAGRPTYPLDERFLAALEAGMPPAGGNALGLDRLILLATGAARLDEVLAFPSARV